jgi:hypothetical protein
MTPIQTLSAATAVQWVLLAAALIGGAAAVCRLAERLTNLETARHGGAEAVASLLRRTTELEKHAAVTEGWQIDTKTEFARLDRRSDGAFTRLHNLDVATKDNGERLGRAFGKLHELEADARRLDRRIDVASLHTRELADQVKHLADDSAHLRERLDRVGDALASAPPAPLMVATADPWCASGQPGCDCGSDACRFAAGAWAGTLKPVPARAAPSFSAPFPADFARVKVKGASLKGTPPVAHAGGDTSGWAADGAGGVD